MKTSVKIILFALFAALLSSCATNYKVQYQVESQNTGSITLKPSSTTSKTNVTINDNLIVSSKNNVKSVEIQNVPVGEYVIVYASESAAYKDPLHEEIKVAVEPAKNVTKLVQTPRTSGAYLIYIAILTVVPLIVYGSM